MIRTDTDTFALKTGERGEHSEAERIAHAGYRVIARRPRSEVFTESVDPERADEIEALTRGGGRLLHLILHLMRGRVWRHRGPSVANTSWIQARLDMISRAAAASSTSSRPTALEVVPDFCTGR